MGLRDLMKVNNSTKPGRIESAQNLMKSSWTIYIENAGKTAKIQRTEEDDKIEDILSYMDSLESLFNKIVTNALDMVECSRKLASSYHDFGQSIITLGLNEGDDLGGVLSDVGKSLHILSTGANNHSENEVIEFQEPLDEYNRMLKSVKDAISLRETKKNDYVRALTNLEVEQAQYNKLLGNPNNDSKIASKEDQVANLQRVAEEYKVNYDQTTEQLLRDFDTFMSQKVVDVKTILRKFVKLQIEFSQLKQKTWEAVDSSLHASITTTTSSDDIYLFICFLFI